jgi:hypothetical protein
MSAVPEKSTDTLGGGHRTARNWWQENTSGNAFAFLLSQMIAATRVTAQSLRDHNKYFSQSSALLRVRKILMIMMPVIKQQSTFTSLWLRLTSF